jgi:translation initiation factor IF-1
VRATIREVLPKGRYRCVLPDGGLVVAGLSGAARVAPVRHLPGDAVDVVLEPGDPPSARILGRGGEDLFSRGRARS